MPTDGLVKVSPCPHGHKLGILAAPPNSTVWDPACRDPKTRKMRPHDTGPAPKK